MAANPQNVPVPSIRERILNSPETLSDFAWAAEQRFDDATALLTTDRFSGAIYLFGLAAEMWLKLACFRFSGSRLNDFVEDQLSAASTFMKNSAGRRVEHESYHSLLFWSEYLMRLREKAKRPLFGELLNGLRNHIISGLFMDWNINLRYREMDLSVDDAVRVHTHTIWLRNSLDELWR